VCSKFSVIDRSGNLSSFVVNADRADFIQKLYPFDSRQSAYNAFGGAERSANSTLWHVFRGQGVELNGVLCVIDRIDHISRKVIF
jgi:hypothetical protein